MSKGIEIRLELGIDAQRFIQQVQLQHGAIEDQIQRGIELALNDIAEGDNLVQSVRQACKEEIAQIVNKKVMSYNFSYAVEKLINERINEKLTQYADKIAESVTSNLKV